MKNLNKLSNNELKKTTRPVESSDITCRTCGGGETGEPDCIECDGRGANVYSRYRQMRTEERVAEYYDNQNPEE